jgi:MarR family transcriptional regulator, transcriptional regulator for hemolysin
MPPFLLSRTGTACTATLTQRLLPIHLIVSSLMICVGGRTMLLLHQDFEQSVGYWLTVVTQAYHRAVSEELAPHGITYRQSMVLGWLALEGELSQTELASKMMVEPPTLVGILDRMERDGWITRNGCPNDRRKNLIRSNPGAEPVWEKIVACALRVRAEATAGMSAQELETLRSLLKRVRQNIESRHASSSTVASH